MPEKWSIKSVVEDQRLMKLHECACEMISKVSENKDLKPHECGRSTLSSKNSRLELEQGLKKPHFLHLQFCTCNNSFPRIPSRHNFFFCVKMLRMSARQQQQPRIIIISSSSLAPKTQLAIVN